MHAWGMRYVHAEESGQDTEPLLNTIIALLLGRCRSRAHLLLPHGRLAKGDVVSRSQSSGEGGRPRTHQGSQMDVSWLVQTNKGKMLISRVLCYRKRLMGELRQETDR